MVKNLPAMQEAEVQFLGRKDPLKEGMATHSSIVAWRIPWTEGVYLKTNRQKKKKKKKTQKKMFFFFCSVKGHLSFIAPRSLSDTRFIKQKTTPLFILASPRAQTCSRRQARGTQEPERRLYSSSTTWIRQWSLLFIHSYSPNSWGA